jgi:hypothetical protein
LIFIRIELDNRLFGFYFLPALTITKTTTSSSKPPTTTQTAVGIFFSSVGITTGVEEAEEEDLPNKPNTELPKSSTLLNVVPEVLVVEEVVGAVVVGSFIVGIVV